MADIISGWWILFLGAVRLYEDVAHAYNQWRKKRP